MKFSNVSGWKRPAAQALLAGASASACSMTAEVRCIRVSQRGNGRASFRKRIQLSVWLTELEGVKRK